MESVEKTVVEEVKGTVKKEGKFVKGIRKGAAWVKAHPVKTILIVTIVGGVGLCVYEVVTGGLDGETPLTDSVCDVLDATTEITE